MCSVSRSNGFMTYSSAPASRAARMCAMSFSVVQKTTLGWSEWPRWRSNFRNSIPLITGMFQSSRTTSGMLASQAVRASRPSPASSTLNSRVSRMCRATLRITLESSTIRQVFIDWFPVRFETSLNMKGNEDLKLRALPRRRRRSRRRRRPAAMGLPRIRPRPRERRPAPQRSLQSAKARSSTPPRSGGLQCHQQSGAIVTVNAVVAFGRSVGVGPKPDRPRGLFLFDLSPLRGDDQVGLAVMVVADHAIAGGLDDRAKDILHPRIATRQAANRLLGRARCGAKMVGEQPMGIDQFGRLAPAQGYGADRTRELGR